MATPNDSLAFSNFASVPLPGVGRISAVAAMKARSKKADCWFFISPKNKRRLAVQGQLAYYQAILLEGDVSVIGYDICDERNSSFENDASSKPAMTVYYRNGSSEWRDFRYEKNKETRRFDKQIALANEKGIPYKLMGASNFIGTLFLFDNWQMLCAAINRTRNIEFQRIQREVFDRCRNTAYLTFGDLLKTSTEDSALVLASVAILLQAGAVNANLENELFSLESVLRSAMS